jgi:hypothetical protein
MKAFIIACVAIVVIAVGSAFVLERYQQDSEVAYASPSGVRI